MRCTSDDKRVAQKCWAQDPVFRRASWWKGDHSSLDHDVHHTCHQVRPFVLLSMWRQRISNSWLTGRAVDIISCLIEQRFYIGVFANQLILSAALQGNTCRINLPTWSHHCTPMKIFARYAFFFKKKKKHGLPEKLCLATLYQVDRAMVYTFPDNVRYLVSFK